MLTSSTCKTAPISVPEKSPTLNDPATPPLPPPELLPAAPLAPTYLMKEISGLFF
mgnify:CR=1 FL=1